MSPRPLFRLLQTRWREYLILWLGLLALAALPAALPAYAAAVAGRALDQRLAAAPTAARNLLISGATLDDALYAQVQETLGPLLRRRVELRDLEIPGISAIYTEGEPRPFDEFLALHLYAFGDLEPDVRLLDGRLPVAGDGAVIEAAIGPETLDGPNFSASDGRQVTITNLSIGDELRAPDGARFRIVGVVEPNDPAGDAWWGTLLPFRFYRQARNGSNLPETVVVSLLVAPEVMTARFPNHDHQWRLLTDLGAVTADNAPAIQSVVRDVETRLSTNFLRVDTGLGSLLDVFLADLSRGRAILIFSVFQALPAALIAFALVAAMLTERHHDEFVALRHRGGGAGRVLWGELPALLLPAIPAAVVAPALGFATLWAAARLGGGDAPGAPPAESWLWAAAGAGLGALVLLLALAAALRRARHWSRPAPLPPARPFWQRYYLDGVLLLLGGLVYRQVLAGGPFTTVGGPADPLLLLGPTLILTALALLAVRLYPYLLRAAGGLARDSSLSWAYSRARAGRAPADGGRLALVAALTFGTAISVALVAHSLTNRQAQLARFLAGADARVGIAIDAGPETYAALAAFEGVAAVTPTYRNERVRWASELNREATLLAVDPVAFPAVGRFPPDVSPLAVENITAALLSPTGAALPAILSNEAYPRDKQVGDIVTYIIGSERVDFEVRGLINTFPSLGGPFLLTNLASLGERIDLPRLAEPWVGQREVWLAAEPGRAASVAAAIERGDGPPDTLLLDAAPRRAAALAADMAGSQAMAAMRLIRWALVPIGAGAAGVLAALAARRRWYEYGVLSAMGVSRRQWLALARLECAVALAVGLAAGAAIGAVVARLMLPILSRVLPAALGNDAIHRLAFDWPSLLGLLLFFVAAFAVALAVATAAGAPGKGRAPAGLGVGAE